MGNLVLVGLIVFGVLAILGIVIGLINRYKRCPSDKLLVIYGKTKGGTASRVIHGGAAFVWPVIQDYEYLDLKPMNMEIDLRNALSSQNIRIDVPSSVTVSVSNQAGVMENAATHLLGLDSRQIQEQAREIIFGQMRQVVAGMTIEQINTDRETFTTNIQENLTDELKKIGLKLINVNIQDIRDESGYIEALGKEAAAKAINDAKVKVAEEDRTGDIGKANADKDRRTKVAEANSQAEIGEADADAEKRTKTASANARAVEGENLAKIEIAESDSARSVKEAKAQRIADAAIAVEAAKAEEEGLVAEKAKEEARANMVESRLRADIVVPAEIDKQKVEVDAEAEAARIRRIAQGEADGELARMTAKGEGIKAILQGTADGFREIVEAAGGDPGQAVMMILADKAEKLMEIQADAIKGIDIDSITVWDSGNGGTTTSDFIQNYLKVAPGLKSVFGMIGEEFPALLQGAGEKLRKEIEVGKEESDTQVDEE